ncbi:hypothetical protein AGMMS49545_19150 [Betaproteobacteria bacterium]|nr:hypothetical protein AGMMS49545_19150 [Betaproteobacteria bacterium]GHU47039.1 hypothetical protein AGMMS50289_21620 [Betaproteobacteria bacterium]
MNGETEKTANPAKRAKVSAKSGVRRMALAALTLCALLLAGYVFSPRWQHKAVGDVTLPRSACDLNRAACHITLPDGTTLIAEITPRPIAVMRPLIVRLNWQDGEADSVALDIVGLDMEMGMNHNILQKIGAGQYLGQATLPVCVTGAMRWRAEFVLDSGEGRVIVPFEFSSEG